MELISLLSILYYTISYVNNIKYLGYINNTSRFSLHCILIHSLALVCQLSGVDTNQFILLISMLSSIIILQTAVIEYYKFREELYTALGSTFPLEIINILLISFSLHFAAFSMKIYILLNTLIIVISYIVIKYTVLQYIIKRYHCCYCYGCPNYHGINYHRCDFTRQILYRIHKTDINTIISIFICLLVAGLYVINNQGGNIYMVLSNYITLLFIKITSSISMFKEERLYQEVSNDSPLLSLIFPNIMN